ncbi:MAG: putative TPR repeat methyltransferase [Halieaceae bacterium]|jgi:predicted TPR repeat methyltransferase
MSTPSMTPDQAIALAKEHTSRGNTAAAVGIYKNILAKSPHHKKAKKALKALQKPEGKKSPDAFKTDMDAVLALYSEAKLDQALTQVKRLCKLHPDQPMPLNVMGTILAGLDKNEQAISAYKAALTLAPDYLDALNNLGSGLHIEGQHDQAIEAYRHLIAMNPNYADAYYNLGNVLYAADQPAESVANYEKAVELRPGVARSHIRLGLALKKLGRANAAMTSFRNALAIDPKRVDALEYMGDALKDEGLASSAVSWYTDAIKLAPDYPSIHFKLGQVLLGLDRREEAIVALERNAALLPEFGQAEHFLAAARGQQTSTAPTNYVSSLFDDYATRFESHLVLSLEYDAPKKLRAMVNNEKLIPQPLLRAIDLGCGTGLCAVAFDGLYQSIDGIDLSSKMIAQAGSKGLYNTLQLGPITTVLESLKEDFNLFIAADTLVYIGDLNPVMGAISNQAAAGAVFAFSTEHMDGSQYELRATGRYAHSKDYIVECTKAAGFELVAYEESNLRKESRGWITGGFYLMKKV